MPAFKFLLCICFFCMLSLHAPGATIDTLTGKERAAIEEAQKNLLFGHVAQMRHYSARGDTIKASEYLLQISPCYFLREWDNSARPDTFLQKLNFTVKAREQYITRYNEALAGRSDAYRKFEQMAREDQKVRTMLERCGDTAVCGKIRRRMRETDSLHFNHLYEYVQKNGWPALEDGSLHATLIAIHDHNRHNYYITYLKAAALKGQTNLAAVELVNHYLGSTSTYEVVLKRMETNKYFQFDVSSMLYMSLPSALPRIQRVFKNACGSNFKYYFFFESPKHKTMGDWVDTKVHKKDPDIFEQLQRELQPYCPKKIIDPIVWEVSWVPSTQVKLKMVVIYMDQPK
jgi:hypothetical protein